MPHSTADFRFKLEKTRKYEFNLNTENIYSETIDLLKQHFGENLKTAVLFRSGARCDAREQSDHDLLIVIVNLPDEPVSRMRSDEDGAFEQ